MISVPLGWTWQNMASLVISLAAIGLSIATYVQHGRYQARPALDIEWNHDVQPNGGVYYTTAVLTNHGNAPATDVRVFLSTQHGADEPWHRWARFEPEAPAEHIVVPLVRNVVSESLLHLRLIPKGPEGHYVVEHPTITVKWRQAPYTGNPKRKKWTMPTNSGVMALQRTLRTP